jgi:outer membrane protein W
MFARNTASNRRHALRSACVAMIALLEYLLVLSVAVRAEGAGDGEASENPPQARLDFRFSAPRFSIGVRGGGTFNRSEGEIYDFLADELTLERSDFFGPAFAADFSWRLTSWMDAVIGFEVSGSSTDSEFRDYVDEFGIPITQNTRLTQVPLTVSLKFYPIGRGRQVGQYAWVPSAVAPYVGGGIGATWYELRQKGEFVDFVDMAIFEDRFTSDGWTFAGHVFLGIDIKLIKSLGLVIEGRYYWANADLRGDFVGFDPIDLDGARVMAGVNWKL